jgi:hypothetical protein
MNLVQKQNPFVIFKILASTLSAAQADTKQQTKKLRGFRRLKPGTYKINAQAVGTYQNGASAKLYPRGETVPLVCFKQP